MRAHEHGQGSAASSHYLNLVAIEAAIPRLTTCAICSRKSAAALLSCSLQHLQQRHRQLCSRGPPPALFWGIEPKAMQQQEGGGEHEDDLDALLDKYQAEAEAQNARDAERQGVHACMPASALPCGVCKPSSVTKSSVVAYQVCMTTTTWPRVCPMLNAAFTLFLRNIMMDQAQKASSQRPPCQH